MATKTEKVELNREEDGTIKIVPGITVSLGRNIGVWMTRDRRVALRSYDKSRELTLTKEILDQYGDQIVNALNKSVLVVGEFQGERPRKPLSEIGKNDNEPKSTNPAKKADNVAVKDSSITDEEKSKIKDALNSKVDDAKAYMGKLFDDKNIDALNFALDYEEGHKNRKSVINKISVDLKQLIVERSGNGVGWVEGV